MVRFVHTADWQLGLRRHFLDDDAQARFTEARIDAITRIGAIAGEQECDFVVVAGDVFEHNQVQRRIVWRALDALGAVPVPVYLLPGNHDPVNAGSIYRAPEFLGRCPPNVVVLDGAAPVEVRPGIEVVGAPWPSKRPLEDLCAAALAELGADAGVVRVLVGHGIVDTLSPDASDPARIGLAGLEAAVRDGRVAYVALGDRHSTTAVGDSGRVWYAGAPEPTAFDEVDPGNVLVVTLDDDSCAVTPHAVGSWAFHDERCDLAGDEDVATVRRLLDAMPDPMRTVVRLTLVGTVSLRGRAELDEVLAEAAETFGSVRTWDRHSNVVVVADDADVAELDLRGFARDAADELSRRAADDDEDGARARDALRLLHRLARSPS